jgi:hypothetical protein
MCEADIQVVLDVPEVSSTIMEYSMAVDDTRKYLKYRMQPLPVKYLPVVSSQYTVN